MFIGETLAEYTSQRGLVKELLNELESSICEFQVSKTTTPLRRPSQTGMLENVNVCACSTSSSGAALFSQTNRNSEDFLSDRDAQVSPMLDCLAGSTRLSQTSSNLALNSSPRDREQVRSPNSSTIACTDSGISGADFSHTYTTSGPSAFLPILNGPKSPREQKDSEHRRESSDSKTHKNHPNSANRAENSGAHVCSNSALDAQLRTAPYPLSDSPPLPTITSSLQSGPSNVAFSRHSTRAHTPVSSVRNGRWGTGRSSLPNTSSFSGFEISLNHLSDIGFIDSNDQ